MTVKNELKLTLFCLVIGGVAGSVLWGFLKLMRFLMTLVWETIPKTWDFTLYPLLICGIGGLLIGLFRKKFGDYPDELMVVFGKLKKRGTYDYQKILVLIAAALLPLVFGASVGPEAGMTGIIVALCCWAGENIRFARKNTEEFSHMASAVTLSVMFHSPLFGLFHETEGGNVQLPSRSKIYIYIVAIAGGMGAFLGLGALFGSASEGFPSFETALPSGSDFLMMFVYMVAGIGLGFFFHVTERLFKNLALRLPPVISELTAGLILGLIGVFFPMIMFSGEDQMAKLMTDYLLYAPMAMIGIAFLKVAMTNLCIRLGLKGGHFFPLIFAAACLGYGIALFVYPGQADHAIFAAAVTAAATMGFSLKKPLAAAMLLIICFPIRMIIWLLLAAVVGAKIAGLFKAKAQEAAKPNREAGQKIVSDEMTGN